MLKMTVADLAQRAKVSPNTVVRVEADKPVNPATLAVLRAAFEAAGIRFTDGGCVCSPEPKGDTA
jgi:transcriptional regulator with XRE-family HTH domain